MRIALIILSLLFSVLVMAQSPKEPPAFAAKDLQGPEPVAVEADSSLKKLIQPFNYEIAEHPRDPFRLPDIPLEPLSAGPLFGPFLEWHEISLDQIKVQGIILNPTSSKVIISYKPSGSDKDKSIVLKVGDPLGENFGRIKSIRDGKVVILQTLEENGVLSTTTRVLSVRNYNLKK